MRASGGGVRASGGVCMVGGHAWLQGGMRGCGGACVVARGCAWLRGVHGCRGGMHGI